MKRPFKTAGIIGAMFLIAVCIGGMSGTAPLPMTIEQPDPGGVSCTTRICSLMTVSWSTVKPTWSA